MHVVYFYFVALPPHLNKIMLNSFYWILFEIGISVDSFWLIFNCMGQRTGFSTANLIAMHGADIRSVGN